MNAVESVETTVAVTLRLPRALYERAAQAASREQRTPEDVLSAIVAQGLSEQEQTRAQWEALSDSYRARLEREGKLTQTPEEVLAELAAVREAIARELYPA